MVRPTPSLDTDPTAGASPSEDVLYGVLSARCRREVLRQLNEAGNEIGLADLAERIALHGESDGGRGSDSAAIRRIHVSLYHVHVPKLAAADVVAFDRAERTVSLTEGGRAIAAELAERTDRGD